MTTPKNTPPPWHELAAELLADATPGTWLFCAYESHDGGGYLCKCGKLWSDADNETPIFEVTWDARGDRDIANAHLIQSAPALLRAALDERAELQTAIDAAIADNADYWQSLDALKAERDALAAQWRETERQRVQAVLDVDALAARVADYESVNMDSAGLVVDQALKFRVQQRRADVLAERVRQLELEMRILCPAREAEEYRKGYAAAGARIAELEADGPRIPLLDGDFCGADLKAYTEAAYAACEADVVAWLRELSEFLHLSGNPERAMQPYDLANDIEQRAHRP